MDPAASRTCAQGGHHTQESHSHNLRKADPEACMTGPEYKSPETGPDCRIQPNASDVHERKAAEIAKQSKNMHGWRRVLRNFTPSYAQLTLIGCLRSLSSIMITVVSLTNGVSYG